MMRMMVVVVTMKSVEILMMVLMSPRSKKVNTAQLMSW